MPGESHRPQASTPLAIPVRRAHPGRTGARHRPKAGSQPRTLPAWWAGAPRPRAGRPLLGGLAEGTEAPHSKSRRQEPNVPDSPWNAASKAGVTRLLAGCLASVDIPVSNQLPKEWATAPRSRQNEARGVSGRRPKGPPPQPSHVPSRYHIPGAGWPPTRSAQRPLRPPLRQESG